jgi:acyl-CoA thioesterase-2
MDLGELFTLEPHGPDTLVGVGPRYPWGGLFGGQIVAQALRAASATVEADLAPHSLRAYFIRRGDHTEPVRYEVDRIRNGRSFATRRVVARQAVGAILNLEASFQRPEPADDHQNVPMPDVVSAEDLPEQENWTNTVERRDVPPASLARPAQGRGRVAAWMRVSDPLDPDDDLLHRCWLAYIADDMPTESVRQSMYERDAPGVDLDTWWGESFGVSLDHSVWFHRPVRADRWHLYDVTCHTFVGARGLVVGHVFSNDGVHVATITQEVLIRHQRAASADSGDGAPRPDR